MDNLLLGILGEHTAASYLADRKYKIYSTNFKTSAGEIDIVAYKRGELHFVEVKTRQAGGMLPPSAAVDNRKQENIKSAAAVYMSKMNLKKTPHYHIIEVLVDGDSVVEINFIQDAF